jgi:hypothetical protein
MPQTNSLATFSLVFGLVSVVTFGATSIAAAIAGHVALGRIKRTGERGHGQAMAGVIIGWLGFAGFLGVLGLWLVLAAAGGAFS